MDHYTVMLVVDAASPVRRFQIGKPLIRKLGIGLTVTVAVLAIGLWDYTRVRADTAELEALRIEVAEQREQIQTFERTLVDASVELDAVRELERKVRIIANLPGATGIGGEGVTELVPPIDPEARQAAELLPPAGVPVHRGPFSAADPKAAPVPDEGAASEAWVRAGATTAAAQRVLGLAQVAEAASQRAQHRSDSLTVLVRELEDKRARLASMPSVWPTKGWLTSRFGPRISPFTGRSQKHAGIDIAGRQGTAIHSPARGRVSSISSRGPLGNSLVVDHGFGLKTFYGHTEEIFVGVGETVERGQRIASMGNSGRSTGPHLHYAVHLKGKARDPLNYIFD